MLSRTRIIIVSMIILLGAGLFSYCAFFYPIDITTSAQAGITTDIEKKQNSTQGTANGGAENNKAGSQDRSRYRAGAI